MEEPMVSVIMPAYNCEKYIGMAIESVLAQSVSFELIIIEDRSLDGTLKVIKKYTDDNRIILIENEKNMGVALSRNRGVENASGKYVAFLDSDDYWTKDKLSKQVALMEEKKAVLSSTGRQLIDDNGELINRYIGIPEKITYKDLLRGNVINTSGVMILTEVIKRFPMTQEKLHEDYIVWLKVLKETDCAYGIDEPLLNYRLMKGSKSGNKLKSARMTFGVYRYMGYNVIQSCYYFICYAINGILKYKIK